MFRKRTRSTYEYFGKQHRFEHWYRDNTVYFITSKVRGGVHAFMSDEAKHIFWNRFDHYSKEFGFESWIRTLMINHYHVIGYIAVGENIGKLMQRLHGSVAKLVNDTLTHRIAPFWREAGKRDYFDGCLRSEKQLSLAYRYVQTQSVRHRICRDWREYEHTRVDVSLDDALRRATERRALMWGVKYKRYER